MKIKKRALEMGCGINPKIRKEMEIYHLDIIDRGLPNQIIHNLNKYPYPLKENSFDYIYCENVLEHLCLYDKKNEYWVNFFNEVYRILKDNGKIVIQVPHFAGCSYIMEHHTVFCIGDFYMKFGKDNPPTWSSYLLKNMNFEIVKAKIIFPTLLKPIGWLININKHTQEVYEKYLSGLIKSQDVFVCLKAIKKLKKRST